MDKQVNKTSVRVNGCGLAIVGVVFGLVDIVLSCTVQLVIIIDGFW